MLIAVIGDCLLDVMVRPQGPMRPGGDVPARIGLAPGGQAANVAVRLGRRGASVRLISPLADDVAARLLRDALEREAVNLAPLPAARTGSVVALVDEHGERAMASERVALDLSSLPELLEDADWVHVSGYALRDAAGDLLAGALGALPPEVRISVGGGSIPAGDPQARHLLEEVRIAGADLLLLASAEASALAGEAAEAGNAGADAPRLASRLAARLPDCLVIVTAGEAGSAAAGPGLEAPLEVEAAVLTEPPLDGTGAGDGYAAALIDELAHRRHWPPSAEELEAAMRAATRLGGLVARVEGAQGHVAGEARLRPAAGGADARDASSTAGDGR
jgi:ribokinase